MKKLEHLQKMSCWASWRLRKFVFLPVCWLRSWTAACLILLVFANAGLAADEQTERLMNKARQHYYGLRTKQDFTQAFRLYLQAAERGDADGMFIVGGMYMKGQGTPINKDEAFKWLYNAALNGRSSRESQRILAEFFLEGQSVPQNFTEALHWFDLAAKGGDPEAQSELAYLYFTGEWVERDFEKAHSWFKRAAENGYSLAQYNMGILWYTGNGVPQVDLVKAYAWFSLAAANGNGSGEVAKRFMQNQLSQEELKQAQELSVQLYREMQSVH